MQVGKEVGELAKSLFGPYVDVSSRDGERLDLQLMIRNTNKTHQVHDCDIEKGSSTYQYNFARRISIFLQTPLTFFAFPFII